MVAAVSIYTKKFRRVITIGARDPPAPFGIERIRALGVNFLIVMQWHFSLQSAI
jgi:hypothetical protein